MPKVTISFDDKGTVVETRGGELSRSTARGVTTYMVLVPDTLPEAVIKRIQDYERDLERANNRATAAEAAATTANKFATEAQERADTFFAQLGTAAAEIARLTANNALLESQLAAATTTITNLQAQVTDANTIAQKEIERAEKAEEAETKARQREESASERLRYTQQNADEYQASSTIRGFLLVVLLIFLALVVYLGYNQYTENQALTTRTAQTETIRTERNQALRQNEIADQRISELQSDLESAKEVNGLAFDRNSQLRADLKTASEQIQALQFRNQTLDDIVNELNRLLMSRPQIEEVYLADYSEMNSQLMVGSIVHVYQSPSGRIGLLSIGFVGPNQFIRIYWLDHVNASYISPTCVTINRVQTCSSSIDFATPGLTAYVGEITDSPNGRIGSIELIIR